MIRLLGYAILILIIIGLLPLIIRLFAAVAVLFVGLALLAAGCLFVVRFVRAITAPKTEQARERPSMKERHQEGQNGRQTQERHQRYGRRQETDGHPQDQGRHQEHSQRQQEKQQWRAGQRERKQTTSDSYYEILGVKPDATREEIEKAWRRLDYGQPLPIEVRRAYQKAYSVLSDPEQRRKYDAELQRLRREKEQRQRQEQEQEWRQQQEQKRRQEHEGNRRTEQQGDQSVAVNYYKRLNVESNATQKDIKMAWRRFAQKWHPDVSKRPNATVVFQSGSEAYNVLSDPEQRGKYDSELQRQLREQQRRQEPNRRPGAAQSHEQNRYRHASHNAQHSQRRRAGKSAQQSRHRRSWHDNGRLFTGTWAKIQRGPWAGTWGVWIESFDVIEGEKAIIRRQNGHKTLVMVIQVLRRSHASRVTLCRVQNIGTL